MSRRPEPKWIVKGASTLFLTVAMFALVAAAEEPAQTPECPQVLASLMPKGAANVVGTFSTADGAGAGSASCDLPFEYGCPLTSKYPAHLKMELKTWEGDKAEAFRKTAEKSEMDFRRSRKMDFELKRNAIKGAAGVNFVQTEVYSTGGTIVYFDWETRCPAAGAGTVPSELPYLPNVLLTGIVRNGGAWLEFSIEGEMTAEAAKESALEVIENFKKAGAGKQ